MVKTQVISHTSAIASHAWSVNTGVQTSFRDGYLISFRYIYPEVGLLDYMIVLFFNF